MPRRPALSEYRAMWLFAMFDLPTETKTDKREYVRFRKVLLKEGFTMLQFSVYARYCATEEAGAVHFKTLRGLLPPEGQVRLLMVTDRQFGKMEVYYGKKRSPTEPQPSQLLLF